MKTGNEHDNLNGKIAAPYRTMQNEQLNETYKDTNS
jgi:hypothetical protein